VYYEEEKEEEEEDNLKLLLRHSVPSPCRAEYVLRTESSYSSNCLPENTARMVDWLLVCS